MMSVKLFSQMKTEVPSMATEIYIGFIAASNSEIDVFKIN